MALAAVVMTVAAALAGTVAAASSASSTASAAAATTATVRTVDVNVPGGVILSPTVPAATHDYYTPCAAGERVVAGGFSTPGEHVYAIDDNPATVPGSSLDAWHMKLINYGDDNENARLYAVCVSGSLAQAVTVYAAYGAINAGTFTGRLFYSGCSRGDKVIGGGWQAFDQPGPFAPTVASLEDHPIGPESFGVEAWTVALGNFGDSPARVAVYAVCVNASAASAVTLRTAVGRLGDGSSGDFFGGCLRGEKIIGGGWVSDFATSGGVFPEGDHPTDTENFGVETWDVFLYNEFVGAPVQVTIYSFCLGT